MIKHPKPRQNDRGRLALLLALACILLALIGYGLFRGFSALHGLWLSQGRITDLELDVVLTSNTGSGQQTIVPERMISRDILIYEFGLTNGANLAEIPFAERRARLLARIPCIQDMKIVRQQPNRVTITVTEREPAVRVAPPKGRVNTGRVADYEGVVFQRYYNNAALPVIREASPDATKPGQKIKGRAAAALRLLRAVAEPGFESLAVQEIETSHPDHLMATLGDYSRVQIAWQDMDRDSSDARASLHRQLKRLHEAVSSRVITQPTLWIATDYRTPGRIYAKDPTRSESR